MAGSIHIFTDSIMLNSIDSWLLSLWLPIIQNIIAGLAVAVILAIVAYIRKKKKKNNQEAIEIREEVETVWSRMRSKAAMLMPWMSNYELPKVEVKTVKKKYTFMNFIDDLVDKI